MAIPVATLGVTIDTKDAKAALAVFGNLTRGADTLERQIQSLTVAYQRLGTAMRTALGGGSATAGGSVGAAMDATRARAAKLGSTITTVGAAASSAGISYQSLGRTVRIAGDAFRSVQTSAGRGALALGTLGGAATRARRDFSAFTRQATADAGGFMGVVIRLTAVFGGLQAAIAGIGVISNFEDIKDSLTALNRGSVGAGNRDFRFARNFARTSPQRIEEVTSAIVGLRNSSIEPTEDLLRLFSDVSSATSDPRGSWAALVKLWQRGQQGGLGVEELEILQNRGVDVYSALQRRLGINRGQVGRVGQTAEGARSMVGALQDEWSEFYGGASELRLDNLSVKWNALTDTVKEAAESIGRGLGRTLHESLDRMTGLVDSGTDKFELLGRTLGHVANGLTAIGSSVITINSALQGFPFGALMTLMGLFAGSGIFKVLSFLNPLPFVGRVGRGMLAAPGNLARATRGFRDMNRTARGFSGGHSRIGAHFANITQDRRALGDMQEYTALFKQLRESDMKMLTDRAAASGRSIDVWDKLTLGLLAMNAQWGAFTVRAPTVIGSLRGITGAARGLAGLVTSSAGAAAAGVLGVAGLTSFASTRQDMKALNKDLEALGIRHADFWTVQQAKFNLFKDAVTDGFAFIGRKISESLGDVFPLLGETESAGTSLSRARGRGGKRARMERFLRQRYMGVGVGVSSMRNAVEGGPVLDPRASGHMARARRHQARLQDEVFDILSLDPDFWQEQTLSNSGVQMGDPRKSAVMGKRASDAHDRNVKVYQQYQVLREWGVELDKVNEELREAVKGLRNFTDTLGSAWTNMVDNIRHGSHSFKEGVRDFFDELGRDLHHRVLDHYLGKPIKQFFQNLMANIFEGLTNPRGLMARQRSGDIFGALFSGLGAGFTTTGGTLAGTVGRAGGALSTINVSSFEGGGFTGSGARVGGIDGRGGFLMIGHPNETFIDHEKGGGFGTPVNVVVNNNANGAHASVQPTADGRGLEVVVENIMANAAKNGGKFTKQMQHSFYLERRVG